MVERKNEICGNNNENVCYKKRRQLYCRPSQFQLDTSNVNLV